MKSKITKVDVMGMELEKWELYSCVANFGVDVGYATLYDIESKEQGKGHATELLIEAKRYYEGQGKEFGGTVALTKRMKDIYKRLNIKEYDYE